MTQTTPDHPNALPLELLPPGWRLYRLGYCGTESPYQAVGYSCNIVKTFRTSDENIHVKGFQTPRAAFVAAVEKAYAAEI